jgi:hypothetical protein
MHFKGDFPPGGALVNLVCTRTCSMSFKKKYTLIRSRVYRCITCRCFTVLQHIAGKDYRVGAFMIVPTPGYWLVLIPIHVVASIFHSKHNYRNMHQQHPPG